MKNLVSSTLVILLATSGGLLGCGSNPDEEEFNVQTMGSGGCPDLSKFYGQLTKMPGNGWIRWYTVTMTNENKTTRGTTARANLLAMLPYANFEMAEQSIAQYQGEIPSIQQSGCEQVTIGTMDYRIAESGPGYLHLVHEVADPNYQPDPASQEPPPMVNRGSLTYRFQSSRSVDITSKKEAIDPCYADKFVMVQKTIRHAWGPRGDGAQNSDQEVDATFVRRLTRALSRVPSSIQALTTPASTTSAMTTVPLQSLRDLRDTPMRPELRVCPYRPGPPSIEDPEMPPSAISQTELDNLPHASPTPAVTPEPLPNR